MFRITLWDIVKDVYYIYIPMILLCIVIQLFICRKTNKVSIRLIPVYIIILLLILTVFLPNRTGYYYNDYLTTVIPLLVVIPAFIGIVIGWIIYGIIKMLGTNRTLAKNTAVAVANAAGETANHVRILFPLGMVCIFSFLINVYVEQLRNNGDDPHSILLLFTAFVFLVCFPIFTISMAIKAFKNYHPITMAGYIMFFITTIEFVLGIVFFTSSRSMELNYEIIMGSRVTEMVIVTLLISLYLLTIGYLRKEKILSAGVISLIATILVTALTILHYVEIIIDVDHVTLTRQFIIYIMLAFVFCISFLYTFRIKD